MPIDHLNLYLFNLLNAPEQASSIMMHYAIFIAHDLIYVMLLIFAILWLRGGYQVKKQILKAFIFTCITLSISEIASAVFSTPRPFVMDLGRTLIEHSPTGSFPSNHMTIFSSIAFAYYFSAQREVGKFLIILAWLVAWSRVYVGVHFPIDMVGGFLLALLVNASGLTLWNKYKEQLMVWVMAIYQKLFQPLIEKGFIK
ncbi:undecaprenyl-diphosphatase [Acinetobacter pragensis]|uniref:undecaprenyl-diphosphate phosphatase n=1 Tax=Acinetobacter pragensis TaxID=1806892 RepID=A0A151Y212_9GAMM|nr:undecaprenyl-diphosphatase [Acinetobacter pragensis]KYQ71999.1 undecaprenyl-diphosphatase [Acinetobacter pragensis]